jgi:hypothetical protein
MPQLGEAERDGWPDGYTEAGVEAARGFFGRTANRWLAAQTCSGA